MSFLWVEISSPLFRRLCQHGAEAEDCEAGEVDDDNGDDEPYAAHPLTARGGVLLS